MHGQPVHRSPHAPTHRSPHAPIDHIWCVGNLLPQVLASAQGFSGSKDGDHQQQVNTALVWSWLRFAVQHFGLEQGVFFKLS